MQLSEFSEFIVLTHVHALTTLRLKPYGLHTVRVTYVADSHGNPRYACARSSR